MSSDSLSPLSIKGDSSVWRDVNSILPGSNSFLSPAQCMDSHEKVCDDLINLDGKSLTAYANESSIVDSESFSESVDRNRNSGSAQIEKSNIENSGSNLADHSTGKDYDGLMIAVDDETIIDHDSQDSPNVSSENDVILSMSLNLEKNFRFSISHNIEEEERTEKLNNLHDIKSGSNHKDTIDKRKSRGNWTGGESLSANKLGMMLNDMQVC